MDHPVTKIDIRSEGDIVSVRQAVRKECARIGFGLTDVTRIVTAASELARNVFRYAGQGTVYMTSALRDVVPGVELKFSDQGPGIPDVDAAMTMGFSTRKGLGLGLPGARRLMDDMVVTSQVGVGTTVIIRKWLTPLPAAARSGGRR